jgi:NitT/TauT family transport system substrate-binding protein
MSITLFESFRAVFYTPFYLAHALGAYEAEGVSVTLGTSANLGSVADQLQSGEVDVYWGGPMRIMMNHDRDPDCGIVGFCEAVSRDPFFIIGALARPDFELSDLANLSLATVNEVPTPWMCLQDDVRRIGIDPAGLSRIDDRSMPENVAALRAGTVDAIQVFQPFAEELIADGGGHLWYAAASRGPCSYTTFYASRDTVARRQDELYRMTRAMFRTQKWLHAQRPIDVAEAVREYFPDLNLNTLAACAERYLASDVWGRSPLLARDGFERLRAALLSGGLIEREIPYEDCVDLSLAERVVAEDPPSM